MDLCSRKTGSKSMNRPGWHAYDMCLRILKLSRDMFYTLEMPSTLMFLECHVTVLTLVHAKKLAGVVDPETILHRYVEFDGIWNDLKGIPSQKRRCCFLGSIIWDFFWNNGRRKIFEALWINYISTAKLSINLIFQVRRAAALTKKYGVAFKINTVVCLPVILLADYTVCGLTSYDKYRIYRIAPFP